MSANLSVTAHPLVGVPRERAGRGRHHGTVRSQRGRLELAHATVPAAPTGAGVEIVVNADADGGSAALARYLQQALPDADVRGCLAGDYAQTVATAASRCRILGVAGGDGSVSLAATHAWRQRLPLLVLPAGSDNRFAGTVGLESVDQALRALRTGSAAFVDVSCVDDPVFLTCCRSAADRSLDEAGAGPAAGLIGTMAAARRLWRMLKDTEPEEIVLEDRRRRLWLWCAANGDAAHGPADGLIGVRAIDADKPFGRLRNVLAVLFGDPVGGRFYERSTSTALNLRSGDGPLDIVLDDEFHLRKSAVVLHKVRCALAVYTTPATEPGNDRLASRAEGTPRGALEHGHQHEHQHDQQHEHQHGHQHGHQHDHPKE